MLSLFIQPEDYGMDVFYYGAGSFLDTRIAIIKNLTPPPRAIIDKNNQRTFHDLSVISLIEAITNHPNYLIVLTVGLENRALVIEELLSLGVPLDRIRVPEPKAKLKNTSYRSCGQIEQFNTTCASDIRYHGLSFCCVQDFIKSIRQVSVSKDSDMLFLNWIHFRESLLFWLQNGQIENIAFLSICSCCPQFKTKQHITSQKIRELVIAPYPSKCNAMCVYCSNPNNLPIDKTTQNRLDTYVDTFKKIFEYDILDENAIIRFDGGEITLLEYRHELIPLANKYKKVKFYSTGILFDLEIAEFLKTHPQSILNISIDAGSREAFKKVKKVDQFEKVVKNIKNYLSYINNLNQLELKYVVSNSYNSKIDDFKDMIKLLKELNYNRLFVNFDCYNKVCAELNDVQDSYFNLLDILIENNIAYRMVDFHTKFASQIQLSDRYKHYKSLESKDFSYV
jgi:molybdenum cofactor biosynthesis enzyme MoaA